MATHASIVFDSGAFLTDEDKEPYSDVGYFKPRIAVYGDRGKVKEIELPSKPKGHRIEIRHCTPDGSPVKEGISLSDCLVEHLLRIKNLYKPIEVGPCYKEDFDFVFHLTSGYFRSSMVKKRRFKELDRKDKTPTGKTKDDVGLIAHDVVVLFQLEGDEELRLVSDNETLWTSRDMPNATSRIELQVLAEGDTATGFFCDSVNPAGNANYWVPNQGDPPPQWRHTGGD